MILITGGLGFIGLHTARRFLDTGEQVVLTQYRVRREPDFIKNEIGKRAFIEALDVTAAHEVIDLVRRHKVTGIVHLAVPGLGALSAAEDYRVNVMGFLNILEAARLFGIGRVSLASSVAVYQSLPEGPFREDALLPVHSGNATETFKKALEILAFHYASRTNLEVIALRIGSPFGPLYHTLRRSHQSHLSRCGERSTYRFYRMRDAERRTVKTIPALSISRTALWLSSSCKWRTNFRIESTTSAMTVR